MTHRRLGRFRCRRRAEHKLRLDRVRRVLGVDPHVLRVPTVPEYGQLSSRALALPAAATPSGTAGGAATLKSV